MNLLGSKGDDDDDDGEDKGGAEAEKKNDDNDGEVGGGAEAKQETIQKDGKNKEKKITEDKDKGTTLTENMDIDTHYTSSMFQEYEEQSMDKMKVDDNPIFPIQFKEKMVSESEKDIIEKGIETAVSLGIDKEGGEEKGTNDDDFVTQAGKKAEGEKTTAIERPKRVVKSVDKFTPTEKKKTVQKTVQKTTIKKPKAPKDPKKQKTMAKRSEKSDPN